MPPHKLITRKSSASKLPRARSLSPSGSKDSDSEWSGEGEVRPQVTKVAKGGALPAGQVARSHAGKGPSRQPPQYVSDGSSQGPQTPPHHPVVAIGALRVQAPERDPAVVRWAKNWCLKHEVVAP